MFLVSSLRFRKTV